MSTTQSTTKDRADRIHKFVQDATPSQRVTDILAAFPQWNRRQVQDTVRTLARQGLIVRWSHGASGWGYVSAERYQQFMERAAARKLAW